MVNYLIILSGYLLLILTIEIIEDMIKSVKVITPEPSITLKFEFSIPFAERNKKNGVNASMVPVYHARIIDFVSKVGFVFNAKYKNIRKIIEAVRISAYELIKINRLLFIWNSIIGI